MEFDEAEFSVEIFPDRRAILDPIATVHVNQIAQGTNFRSMNMSANDPGHAVLPPKLNHGIFVIGDVLDRRLGPKFDVGGERPVTEAERSSNSIHPHVHVQNPVVQRGPDAIQQTVEMSQAIKLVSVNNQVTFAVGSDMHRALDQADRAKGDAKKFFQKLIVIARDEGRLRAFAILAQQFLDEQIVFFGPKPFSAQLPAVDEIADDIQMTAVGVAQELEEFA